MKINLEASEWSAVFGPALRRKKPSRKGVVRQLATGPILLMAQTCFVAVMGELTKRKPEVAGMLLGPAGHHAVTHFVLDETGIGTPGSFTFDHARLNHIIKQYVGLGLDGKGYVHSHPSGCTRLSQGDLIYVAKAFANPKNDLHEVLMPIVVDGIFHPFIIYGDTPNHSEPAQLTLF